MKQKQLSKEFFSIKNISTGLHSYRKHLKSFTMPNNRLLMKSMIMMMKEQTDNDESVFAIKLMILAMKVMTVMGLMVLMRLMTLVMRVMMLIMRLMVMRMMITQD